MTPPPLADAPSLLATASDGRPDFLVRLGLLIPCSVEDVEAAFRDAAKQMHPDRGGTVAEFVQLEADYEAALEYARIYTNRRGWLAANIERYAAQQELIAEIERRGGSVETHRPAWIAREIGDDFAQVIDTITAVRLTGPEVGLADVQYLARHRELLGGLHRLDLSGSLVDLHAVRRLAALPTLHELDLRGTYAGNRTAAVLAEMPALRRVNVSDTFVTWRGVWRLRRRRPDIEVITQCDEQRGTANTKRGYRWLMRLLAAYVFMLVLGTHFPGEPEVVRHVRWPGADKLAHFGIYCGLASLIAFSLSWRCTDRQSLTGLSAGWYGGIAVFVAAFAAVDELTQPWTGRERDFNDWLADVAGMAFGLILFAAIMLYRRQGQRLKCPQPKRGTP
jgi:VanZ family protein